MIVINFTINMFSIQSEEAYGLTMILIFFSDNIFLGRNAGPDLYPATFNILNRLIVVFQGGNNSKIL